MNESFLKKNVSEVPLVAFDLETTGFSPRSGDEIIEIGAVKILGGTIIEEFQTLVNPFRPISPGASAVNGITNGMVAGEPPIESVFPMFLDFIGDLPLIIHNAAFDMPFIAWKACDLGCAIKNNIVFDTLKLSRTLNPHFENHKLGTIVENLGLAIAPAHRALEDSRAAWMIFNALISSMSGGAPVSIENALRFQGGPFPWPVVEPVSAQPLTDMEKVIQQAIESKINMSIQYFSPYANLTTMREIRPLRLVRRMGRSYVVADCFLRNEQRTFRVDRIFVNVEATR